MFFPRTAPDRTQIRVPLTHIGKENFTVGVICLQKIQIEGSNRHLTHTSLPIRGRHAEIYSLLHIVVEGQGVSEDLWTFLYDVQFRSIGASKLFNFAIFPIFSYTMLLHVHGAPNLDQSDCALFVDCCICRHSSVRISIDLLIYADSKLSRPHCFQYSKKCHITPLL